jgi:hypothetical protein
MRYEHTLLMVSVFLGAVGLAIIIIPAQVSEMMGTPIEEIISSTCETYELAKQDLVRLVGTHTLSVGLLCIFLRRIQDKATQGLVLKGLVFACIPVSGGGMASSLGWLPMSVSVLALSMLLAGLYRHGQQTGSAAPSSSEPTPETSATDQPETEPEPPVD